MRHRRPTRGRRRPGPDTGRQGRREREDERDSAPCRDPGCSSRRRGSGQRSPNDICPSAPQSSDQPISGQARVRPASPPTAARWGDRSWTSEDAGTELPSTCLLRAGPLPGRGGALAEPSKQPCFKCPREQRRERTPACGAVKPGARAQGRRPGAQRPRGVGRRPGGPSCSVLARALAAAAFGSAAAQHDTLQCFLSHNQQNSLQCSRDVPFNVLAVASGRKHGARYPEHRALGPGPPPGAQREGTHFCGKRTTCQATTWVPSPRALPQVRTLGPGLS